MRTRIGLMLTGSALLLMSSNASADHPGICGAARRAFEPADQWTRANFRELRELEADVDPQVCPDLAGRISDRINQIVERPPPPPPPRLDPSDGPRTAAGPAAVRRLYINEEPVRDVLRDNQMVSDLRYDQYHVRLREGDGVRVVVQSQAFQPIIAIGNGLLPNEFSQLAFVEAQTGETNATLEYVAPNNGGGTVSEYVVVVAATAAGDYSVELSQFTPPPPPPPRTIQIGQTQSGELNERSARGGDYDQPLDIWRFQATAGQPVRIFMGSEEFDTYLIVGREVDGAFSEIQRNDDGGRNLDSLIIFTPDQSGEYQIRAMAFSGAERGPYTLSVEAPVRVTDVEPRRISNNTNAWVVEGEIGPDSASDENFNYYVDHVFRARRGRHYVVTETSGSAIVELGRMRDGELQRIDFFTEETVRPYNAVEFDSDRGPYILRVRSASPGLTGAYSLVITEREREESAPAPEEAAAAPADDAVLCRYLRSQFESSTWTTDNASELNDLRSVVDPQQCPLLAEEISVRVTQLYPEPADPAASPPSSR